MKPVFFLAALTLMAAPPAFATDVGVSISIGDPGFYGRIDIGDFPRPRLIYQEPRIIHRAVVSEPVYLHVPPGHAKNWRKHCHKYDACGERVYFVQDNWYNDVYVPRYQERHYGGKNKYQGNRKEHPGQGRSGKDHGRGRDH